MLSISLTIDRNRDNCRHAQVVESYIKTMLDSVDVVVSSNGSVEDPLDDEGSLKEQMERLPVISRLKIFDNGVNMSFIGRKLLELIESGSKAQNNRIDVEENWTKRNKTRTKE